MDSYRDPAIKLSRSFDPTAIIPFEHALHQHPLLQLPKLIELGKRLASVNSVRYHNDRATEGTSFNEAPRTNPAALSIEESLREMENAHVWMSLLNVQQDPEYRKLVDEVLDFVRPQVQATDPGMCFRACWIFVSSPGAITPFHMDTENSFFFHLRGEKRFHAWHPADRAVMSEQALEQFHAEHSRAKLVYSESLLATAQAFDFQPGQGVFMPVTAPHMVRNGNTVSISMSCTYYSDRTRRLRRIYRGNHRLRSLGLAPRPVGEAPLIDAAKSAAVLFVQYGRQALRRLRQQDPGSDSVPYARP